MKHRGTQPKYSGITARPFRLSMLALLFAATGGWRPTILPSPVGGDVGRRGAESGFAAVKLTRPPGRLLGPEIEHWGALQLLQWGAQ